MSAHPALVLNADFRPLSVSPLSLMDWQDAVKLVCKGAVSVVAEYDKTIRSTTTSMKIPSVIALREYVRMPMHVAFTRYNVFLRDRFRCQYCGEKKPSHELTFEHVIPRARGGQTTWENIVSACEPCNTAKGDSVDMKPLRQPRKPTPYELYAARSGYPPNFLHETWLDYLFWDSEIEN